MINSFWAFLGVSVLVIVTPGPDTMITVRSTLLGGRAAGLATALGVSIGQMIWVLATSLGLVALLLASEAVFAAVKLAGAAYLIWLGAQTIAGATRGGRRTAVKTGASAPQRLSVPTALRQGLISDLGNPKMAVFFASVLPQFAIQGEGMLSALVGLGAVFALLTLSWLALYVCVIAAAGPMYARSRLRRPLEGLMGGILVALGLRLATEHR